jgi:hypothetical protein
MNNQEPFDEVSQVRMNRSNEDGLLSTDALTGEFRQKFQGQALEDLAKEYDEELRQRGGGLWEQLWHLPTTLQHGQQPVAGV